MAFRLTLLAVLVTLAWGRPEGTGPLSSCQLAINVVYPTEDGAAPYPECSSQCPTGDADGLWYEGVAYKRFCDLESYNLMVEATFEDGQLKGCKMVPYATTEELIAQQDAQQEALDQCLGNDKDVSAETSPVPTTTFTETTQGFVTDSTATFTDGTAPVETTELFTTVRDSTVTSTTEMLETTTIRDHTITPTPEMPETTTIHDSTIPPTSEMPETTTVRDSTVPPTTVMPTTTTAPTPPVERCGEGFTRMGDSCYMVSPTLMSMMDGAAFCDSFGAMPASVDSQAEQDQLKAKLTTDVWIGFNDIAQEGKFMSPGRSDVSYTNWNSGEPNNYNNNEDCTMLVGSTGYRWNDDNCAKQARILCEQPLSLDTRKYTCPEGYMQRETSCYRLGDQTGTYAQGEQFCSSIGGYPVFINSQEEQDFLAATVTVNAYIGLSDRATEGTFRAENFGVPLYRSWYQGEPNNLNDEDCTELQTGFQMKWNDLNCNTQIKVLCEVAATPVKTYRCPAGTAKFEETSCFLAGGTVATGTHDDAVNFCNAQGMNVATIRSAEEQAFAAGLLKGNTWISLTDAAKEGVFVWGDGSPADFTSFGTNEPNDLRGQEDCIEMNAGMGFKWNDESCSSMRQFLCKTATIQE